MKTLALILCLIAAPAAACDGIAFSQGDCYSQAIVAKQVVPHYQQQIVLPLNQYAYGQPEAIVLPQKVQIVRPETVLRLEQVHGYQQPLVVKQYGYAVQQFNGHHVQQLNNHHAQQLNHRGQGGVLGRIQDNIQARKADRQAFRQQQALNREAFKFQLANSRHH